MKKIFGNLLHYKSNIPIALLFMTFATICDLMLPTIMSNIVDNGIYLSDMDYIKTNCLYMFITALFGLASTVIGTKFTAEIVSGFCCDLRRMVFSKVNTLTFGEVNRIGTAALITRSTHDTETLGWIASIFCGNILTIPMLFFGGVILSFRKDVLLSLIILFFVPIVFITVIIIGKKIEPLWRISDEFIDKQNDIMRERLRGIRVIRAFGKEDHEHERIADATRKMAYNIIKSNVSMGVISPFTLFLLNFSVVLIVYIGAIRMEIGASAVSAGDIFAIIQYVTLIMTSIINASFVIVMMPHAKVAINRISEVLSAKGYSNDIPEESLEFSGSVIFDNVSFKYEGATEPAVSNVSFKIEPGQKVSIIGGTGSGKSTLVSLMMCFRIPTEGKVIYDGRSTDSLNHKTVRKNISCVLQNSSIYSGTIKDNILMGKPDANDEEIYEAANIAELSDFVKTLENGFEHELNQSGKNLSGGQKQRLSIARAVIRNAPIYIFDDSFSALDFLTESKLRANLAKKANGRTQIVVTQRVTSAMNSDIILVMDKGKLIDLGKHNELLERCEIYREIYDSQTGGSR